MKLVFSCTEEIKGAGLESAKGVSKQSRCRVFSSSQATIVTVENSKRLYTGGAPRGLQIVKGDAKKYGPRSVSWGRLRGSK